MTSSIAQFKHSPPDKRGLGLTFLGMMAPQNEAVSSTEYVTQEEFAIAVRVLRKEINALNDIVMVMMYEATNKIPWYSKLWVCIKRTLHIGE